MTVNLSYNLTDDKLVVQFPSDKLAGQSVEIDATPAAMLHLIKVVKLRAERAEAGKGMATIGMEASPAQHQLERMIQDSGVQVQKIPSGSTHRPRNKEQQRLDKLVEALDINIAIEL